MEKKLRGVLSNMWFIHGLFVLGMVALIGNIATQNDWLMLGVAASFGGAVCGSFIRMADHIKR